MEVHVASATVSAFQPEIGAPHDRFTVSATAAAKGTPPPAPTIRPTRTGILVDAPYPLANLLLRVPDGVTLVVVSRSGDVRATNVQGPARLFAGNGNVQAIVPGYAQALAVNGNLGITIGGTTWPGTLHFGTGRGDIVIWINEGAAFRVHLHTDDGTLFTDFDLRGSSAGKSETIDGAVNGGGAQRIDVETRAGTIRLLRLHPEA